MKTDIEIAQEAKLEHISKIAARAGLQEDDIEYYGKYKAKIDLSVMKREKKDGKLVLVTAITPTPAGEGKTTTTIGLADGLRRIGKNVVVALREPSLGPVFGVKGGAAGGGYAQVVPMEEINLHFTGDMHAIGAANNLLAAMLDNHIFQGNALGIDKERITWKRCVDMNDRQLRVLEDGLGGGKNGVPRRDGFDITVASEVMAILCLATSLSDLKARLARIVVGYTYEGKPVTAGDLKAAGAMCALLKDAMKPNLVQTLEGTPAIVHGGPFANIAHGCNSVVATRTALKLGDYVVTEAGFGADLGAEKFLDTKCRIAGIEPDCVVVVATVKALKLHGGADKANLSEENLEALGKGLPNLYKHIENIKNVYHKPVVVAMNRFASDTPAEIALVMDSVEKAGAKAVFTDVFLKGGEGGKELAEVVLRAAEEKSELTYSYDLNDSIEKKISDIVRNVYGGDGVTYSDTASEKIAEAEARGYGKLPVIIAKTQYSLSDDAKLLARPTGFTVHVRDIIVKGGAGFVVAVAGSIMLMPGLGKHPAAERIFVDERGEIEGLS